MAAAVTAAGGLGIIGGGCGDGDWLDREFAAERAVAEAGTEESGVFVGEAIGLMQDVSPVSGILACVSKEAEMLLRERATALVK